MGWAVTLRALRRRWYVVVVGVLVSAVLGFLALTQIPPAYQVSGTVLLLPSTQQTDEQGNPFLGLDSLSATGLILAARLNSDQEATRIVEVAPTGEYLVGPDPILGEPALLVTAQDRTEEGAFAVLDAVLDEIPVALAQLQEEVAVPEPAVITSLPLTRALEPEVVTQATERALVAAVGGGLALTVGAAVGIDALARRRHRRAQAAGVQDEDADATRADEPQAEPDRPAAPAVTPVDVVVPVAAEAAPVAGVAPAPEAAPVVAEGPADPVAPVAPEAAPASHTGPADPVAPTTPAAPPEVAGPDAGAGVPGRADGDGRPGDPAPPAPPADVPGAAAQTVNVPGPPQGATPAPRRSPWPPVEAPRRHARSDKAPALTSVLPSSWSLGSLTWPGNR